MISLVLRGPRYLPITRLDQPKTDIGALGRPTAEECSLSCLSPPRLERSHTDRLQRDLEQIKLKPDALSLSPQICGVVFGAALAVGASALLVGGMSSSGSVMLRVFVSAGMTLFAVIGVASVYRNGSKIWTQLATKGKVKLDYPERVILSRRRDTARGSFLATINDIYRYASQNSSRPEVVLFAANELLTLAERAPKRALRLKSALRACDVLEMLGPHQSEIRVEAISIVLDGVIELIERRKKEGLQAKGFDSLLAHSRRRLNPSDGERLGTLIFEKTQGKLNRVETLLPYSRLLVIAHRFSQKDTPLRENIEARLLGNLKDCRRRDLASLVSIIVHLDLSEHARAALRSYDSSN